MQLRFLGTFFIGCGLASAQGLLDLAADKPVSDPICPRFLQNLDTKGGTGVAVSGLTSPQAQHAARLAALTRRIETGLDAAALPGVPGGSRTGDAGTVGNLGLIDKYIFSAMENAGVQPADPTNDYEFIRRVTLDMTGRIPDPNRVLLFAASTDPNKRTALVEELLARPEWVDKWTMFFGDLYRNNSANSQIRRYADGVEAFYQYLKGALSSNKPYNLIAQDLITATGDNSYTTGTLNYLAGGVATGGPIQDIFDLQTANIANDFLGITHVNCLLCHNGRGHLDTLSLWASQQSRVAAWGLSSFLSRTYTSNTRVDSATVTPYYWGITDSSTKAGKDYPLNTTTGNRPPRQPAGSVTNVSPAYLFTGETPRSGENYRAALARMVTADPQFARAAVNYMWAYFFGVGLVDPPNAFDPLRLDPDNPPPAGWTLQPSNPRLLNALALAFVQNGYDLKWLMRQIVNSQAYQLSSRYNGQWNDAWAGLYARKFVRRLWSEEVHDAIAVSSGLLPTYTLTSVYGTVRYAMQLPETTGLPDGANGNITGFLDAFLRGNRDDQQRSDEGSIQQALNLLNDSFVVNRTTATGAAVSPLLAAALPKPDAQMVDTLFLAVLSRHPSAAELAVAAKNLAAPGVTRTVEAQNLLWSLYNKVDFVFNY